MRRDCTILFFQLEVVFRKSFPATVHRALEGFVSLPSFLRRNFHILEYHRCMMARENDLKLVCHLSEHNRAFLSHMHQRTKRSIHALVECE